MIRLELQTENVKIIKLSQAYWQVDSLGNFVSSLQFLIQEFGIEEVELLKIVSTHSCAYSTEMICHLCQKPCCFQNRIDFKMKMAFPTKSWQCDSCYQKKEQEQEENKRQEEQNQRLIILKHYSLAEKEPIPLETLSLTHAIYLLSMIRLGANEACTSISPIYSFHRPLSPTRLFDQQIVKSLYEAGILFPHPHSSVASFVWKEGVPHQFHVLSSSWGWPEDSKKEPSLQTAFIYLETKMKNKTWPISWKEEVPILIRKILLEETLQYLYLVMKEHTFEWKAGEKTRHILLECLEYFSVSQILNFMWRSARDAAAFFVRQGVSKAQAANTVILRIQRYAEEAKACGINIKPFRRNLDAEQSMVSQVFFHRFLQISGSYLDMPLFQFAFHVNQLSIE